ncbi:helix-turn-helix domain-containing protein [Amycolatopsis rhizosphaerae]|uniref:Helix-turn-helix domain-containing protein n=1 Tax=Amycolatopsis rhizosphaerae TaxID=2053003 RepID=A0A558CVD1_9PSEU|nr:helix-turn-helix transcriptional regulator [Amycolatopsis rhizosphaerae]TVT52692.1 helix-turn-helix domain-containing protein [Amycolatopsis rhizosphaerae]
MDQSIGEFLRSRRARIQPREVGLPGHGRRRVPGLRREELAQLAGVSVDYYVRLEQGRSQNVSDAVLDSIARVLRLDETERVHLRNLVRPAKKARRSGGQHVRPGVQRMLDMMTDLPAFVLGRRMDILAWNALADAVIGFSALERPNAARHTFLHPEARELYLEWDAVAAETVAYLRLDAGRYPDDPQLCALVGELSMRSEPFRRLWARQDVKDKTHGRKLVRHPFAGDLEFRYETFASPGDSDQLLVAYTVAAGSASEERLRLLASWQAPEIAVPAR